MTDPLADEDEAGDALEDEDEREDEAADDSQTEGVDSDDDGLDGDGERSADPSGAGGMWLWAGLVVVALVVFAVHSASRPSAHIETYDPEPMPTSVPRPAPVAPSVALRAEPPPREPTPTERVMAGTYVGTGVASVPVSAAEDREVISLSGGTIDTLPRCIWLELYDNLRGLSQPCAMVNGEATIFSDTDLTTGRPTIAAVPLHWSHGATGLSITYDEPMQVRIDEVARPITAMRLELPAGSPPFAVQQSFPEHADVPARTAQLDIFPGRYLD